MPTTNVEADDPYSGGANLSVATPPGAEDFVITNNSASGIYEAAIAGRTAAGLVYSQVGSRVILSATSVFPEFRGKGVAGRLIGGVLDEPTMPSAVIRKDSGAGSCPRILTSERG